jgi:hypothetical protein
MLLAWVIYPLAVAALGAGWGVLVEKASGNRINGALLIPVGLAAVLVVAGLITVSASTAPATTTICGAGAVGGLAWGRPWQRLALWPSLAAVGVLLAYGAPVILSGHTTFLGYLRLDDTATWFNIVDNVISHGRSVAGLHPSTFTLVYTGDVGAAYPLGAFMLPGVTRALTGIDIAWVFQPCMACLGAAIGLSVYAIAEPLVESVRKRALIAFLAAQPALLYGYSLWGGVKEMTSAMLLALGVAFASQVVARRPTRGRELLGLSISAGGLLITLSVGAVAWIAPALAILLGAWVWQARRTAGHGSRWWRGPVVSTTWLTGMTIACAVPLWAVISTFLSNDSGLFSAGQTSATQLGNLLGPLSGFQLAGIWTTGDFRTTASAFPTALLVALVIAVVLGTLLVTIRRHQLGPAMYVAVALPGCAIFALAGSTPWVMGKSLAISSPALLAAALIGATMLCVRRRAGVIVVALLAIGVIWSNVLGYHDALLAPHDRLAELQHIENLVSGKGPTFINDYEIFADRHFLRDGAPVEPAEYRPVGVPTSRGALLVKTAYADLDSFSVPTLMPYRSIVVRDSPVESRPPSIYRLVWAGRYYALYQRPATPSTRVLEHVALGDQNVSPYCGAAENGPQLPLCSIAPAAVPPCRFITNLVPAARAGHATIVAFQRPAPIVIRGDQLQWPGRWLHDPVGHTLTPETPGTAVAHIQLVSPQQYELWLGGSFTRGFDVNIDGRDVGRVKDEIFDIDGYVPVVKLFLAAGVHTVSLTYPHADLTAGSGDNLYTNLTAIALQPLQTPETAILSVTPDRARTLCGRSLDWIEVVAPV